MLHIYGSPLSSPTNKVRYVANYLEIPYEFHVINLGSGQQSQPEFLKINPLGKVPAIDDDGFTLGESNAIIRYLADKQSSLLYPRDLQKRAIIDQWMDYAAQHVAIALGRIMYNTYFYKFAKVEIDERSLQDGRRFISLYLPKIENQLKQSAYLADNTVTLADIGMLATLDTCEACQVELSEFPHIVTWRNKLMKEAFYQKCHESYTESLNKVIRQLADKIS
ncbi:MAG: glutathione S-transferase family protein [Gammaproteobacteria bacterium]